MSLLLPADSPQYLKRLVRLVNESARCGRSPYATDANEGERVKVLCVRFIEPHIHVETVGGGRCIAKPDSFSDSRGEIFASRERRAK